MMRDLLIWMGLGLATHGAAQRTVHPHEIPCGDGTTSVQVHPLHRDGTCSSSLLCISGNVAAHYHARHTEHVAVLAGHGWMRLGNDTLELSEGTVVVIPAGTVHAAWCSAGGPLRVMSVFAPPFDGVDRIPVELPDR